MAAQGLQPVSSGYALTGCGRAWLQRLGFEAPEPSTRRRFAYPCLDWSERRDHLAGQLGDQLYLHLVAQGWVRRGAGCDADAAWAHGVVAAAIARGLRRGGYSKGARPRCAHHIFVLRNRRGSWSSSVKTYSFWFRTNTAGGVVLVSSAPLSITV